VLLIVIVEVRRCRNSALVPPLSMDKLARKAAKTEADYSPLCVGAARYARVLLAGVTVTAKMRLAILTKSSRRA
jgi:hypothetical protein